MPDEREKMDFEILEAAAESYEYECGVLAGQEAREAISHIKAKLEELRRDLRYLADAS